MEAPGYFFCVAYPAEIPRTVLRTFCGNSIYNRNRNLNRNLYRNLTVTTDMIYVSRYRISCANNGLYKVIGLEVLPCPVCGSALSGYDSRRRCCIDGAGSKKVYLLRRLRCTTCNRLHLELPDFIAPQKHYEAQVIENAALDPESTCPAETSTIRRWKKNPPVLPR